MRVEGLMVQAGLLSEGESLYDPGNIRLLHHLNAALRAHAMYRRDVEYVVKDGEVVIVDEFTGRTMPGRRWGDGLHQAVEAKEGVAIKQENQTVASITFQNYFRLYNNLSGMTGTADTEAFEFQQIYGLEVVVIPTHKPMVRDDQPDLVYLTESDKYEAIVEDIVDCKERGQPALVGTTSIESSELLSNFLKKKGVQHQVLNAKQHEREAHIIQNAGRPGADDDRHQHGGSRYRYRAGRQSRGRAIAELGDERRVRTKPANRVKTDWQGASRCGARSSGGSAYHRHRTPRVPAYRQSASWPIRSAGRSGVVSRFYLSTRRQPDAYLRRLLSASSSLISQKLGMRRGRGHREHPWVTKADREMHSARSNRHNFDIRKTPARVRRRRQRSASSVVYEQRN